MLNHSIHSTLGSMMRPSILTLAMFVGVKLNVSIVLASVMMIDWIAWPLHMLPHFLFELNECRRGMRRIQRFLMLDEVQEGVLDKKPAAAWGKPAL